MTGIELIAQERQRQIDQENWQAEHDDSWVNGELALAAMVYCIPFEQRVIKNPLKFDAPQGWPWAEQWYKPEPNDRIRELVKAGALIAAEIDRLQRTNR